jgi:hypothetical protein
MRTAVADGKIFSIDVEDADFASVHAHQSALAWRYLVYGCNDMPRHQPNP